MSEVWTVQRVLKWTQGFFAEKGIESARLDAELLIAHALKINRMQLYLRLGQPLSPDELVAIRQLVKRRGRREPVAYITGSRGFWALEIGVGPGVLVPRPETEGLVEIALARLAGKRLTTEVIETRVELFEVPPQIPTDGEFTVELDPVGEPSNGQVEPEPESEPIVPEPDLKPAPSGPRLRVADVGTGSGCIALTLASERPDIHVFAVDCSKDALEIAQKNAESLSLTVTFLEGSLLEPLPEGLFDLIASNPPYIPSADIDELMADVRDFEPRLALDGGPDGLAVIRPLIDQAAARLRPGASLLIEIGADQGPQVQALCEADGRFAQVVVHPDLQGKDRVIEAVRA